MELLKSDIVSKQPSQKSAEEEEIKEKGVEGPPYGELKRWLDFDRLVRREQQRKVASGLQEKTKFTFEFQDSDWLSMLGLLPDILAEMDDDITH